MNDSTSRNPQPANLTKNSPDAPAHGARDKEKAVTAEAPPIFSPRELEVLLLMMQGITNKEIARKLFVTQSTVEFHLGRIFRKLKVHTRTQAAMRAWDLGLHD